MTKETVSLRSRILEAKDIQEELVAIPEWGDVKVLVRGMNGTERAIFLHNQSKKGEGAPSSLFVDIIIATAVDPDTGDKVFERADTEALNAKSGAAINRLAMKAMAISGLSDAAVVEVKEDLRGPPRTAILPRTHGGIRRHDQG